MEYDPLYVSARAVLLDALAALGEHRRAVVVVGAQAVYLRTGDAPVGVAPYTTDADLALTPSQLADEPLIESVLHDAEFRQEGEPGQWLKTVSVAEAPVDVPVDLMVPSGFAPPGGRRSVRLPPHDKMVARKARGLEGAVIDFDVMRVEALDAADDRAFSVRVAGPAALLVAKVHKLLDRIAEGRSDRLDDKDAADVYRLMLVVPRAEIVGRMGLLLADAAATDVTREALDGLRGLFGARRSQGVLMAVEALRVGAPEERVVDVCTGFVRGALADLSP
jgi:CBS domain-containing protein